MQTREFLDSLATVDTADPDALQDFFNATQCQPYENEPDLIPIGSHDGVQYFIHSSDIEIPQDWSTTRGQQYDQERFAGVSQTLDGEPFGLPLSPSPSIDSHVRIPPRSFSSWHGTPQGSVGSPTGTPPRAVASSAGTNPSPDLNDLSPEEESEIYSGISIFSAKQYGTDILGDGDLKYGFGIGRLHHKMTSASRPEETGFYVICNAIDKSIWIAFDFEPYGETGDVHTVKPEYGDPYGQLPGDKQMIGVQRLSGEDWRFQTPYSLDRGDPFTSGAGRPMAIRLFAKPAYVDEVVKASQEYRGSRAAGTGSTA